jgi:hypothetical protein
MNCISLIIEIYKNNRKNYIEKSEYHLEFVERYIEEVAIN